MCNFTKQATPSSGLLEWRSASLCFCRVLPFPYALLGTRIYQDILGYISFLIFPEWSVVEGYILLIGVEGAESA